MVTVGIDEVGRGCWAGPVVAGAVVLRHPIAGLKDSKLLSKLQRQKLATTITIEAAAVGIGWVSALEVDTIGLTAGVGLAMERAFEHIKGTYDEIIIDGNINYFASNPKARAVVKADNSVASVSAASIVAKVARDSFMYDQALLFPHYGFQKHVGYGTKLHLEALRKYGVCNCTD